MPTKIRRTRRLFVNIEADSCRKCSCSMNKRDFLNNPSYDPWALAKYKQMERNAAFHAYALTNLCYTEPHWHDWELSRQLAGLNKNLDNLQHEQQANAYYQPSESLNNQSCFAANQADSTHSMGDSAGYAPDLNTLTNMLQQTMVKLDSLLSLQAEQQAQVPQFDMSYVPQLFDAPSPSHRAAKSSRGKRLVKVMSLQPLVIMPAAVASQAATTPAAAPAAPAAPAPHAKSLIPYTRHRTRVRKKRCKAAGSSASSSQVAEPACHMKDAGTTMWCPRSCCKHCCGIVTNSATNLAECPLKGQQMEAKDTPIAPLSIPIQLTLPQNSFLGAYPQLSPLGAGSYAEGYSQNSPVDPPRSNGQSSIDQSRHSAECTSCDSKCSAAALDPDGYSSGSQRSVFIDRGSYALAPPHKDNARCYEQLSGHSSKCSSLDSARSRHDLDCCTTASERERALAGKFYYSYTEEEEEEEQLGTESELEQSSGDEWYQKVRNSLDELERQQNYFCNKKIPLFTCDKLQQTDCSSFAFSPFISTTDKAVGTADLQATNPHRIVRMGKASALKRRRRKPLHKPQAKVKFLGPPKRQTFPLQLDQAPLQSMSEAVPRAEKSRFYTHEQLARYQKLLALVESTGEADRKVYSQLKGNPLIKQVAFRSKGGTGSTSYPTNWSQLRNSYSQHALPE